MLLKSIGKDMFCIHARNKRRYRRCSGTEHHQGNQGVHLAVLIFGFVWFLSYMLMAILLVPVRSRVSYVCAQHIG